jgi:hypothetical protein
MVKVEYSYLPFLPTSERFNSMSAGGFAGAGLGSLALKAAGFSSAGIGPAVFGGVGAAAAYAG